LRNSPTSLHQRAVQGGSSSTFKGRINRCRLLLAHAAGEAIQLSTVQRPRKSQAGCAPRVFCSRAGQNDLPRLVLKDRVGRPVPLQGRLFRRLLRFEA